MNSLMSNPNQHQHHNLARGLVTLKPSRKRKDAEGGFDAPLDGSSTHKAKASNAITTSSAAANSYKAEPGADNRLLAGYLAHEFLAHGTLFGQKYDPARAEAVPISARSNNHHLKGRNNDKKLAEPSIAKKDPAPAPAQCYNDVARLMKSGGVHIPGVTNPTQLARWLQNQM